MNECLTTPQHEKQIGYWVSEKGKLAERDAALWYVCSLIVRWVIRSILHGGSIELFFVPPSICCPVCGMMHIK